jgi:hypothetical protein
MGQILVFLSVFEIFGTAPPLPYKVDTSCPSLRTNWTRLVPVQAPPR